MMRPPTARRRSPDKLGAKVKLDENKTSPRAEVHVRVFPIPPGHADSYRDRAAHVRTGLGRERESSREREGERERERERERKRDREREGERQTCPSRHPDICRDL